MTSLSPLRKIPMLPRTSHRMFGLLLLGSIAACDRSPLGQQVDSPVADGSTIAYNSARSSPSRPAIWTMKSTGGTARVLIPDAYDAAWMPDGRHIAFVSPRVQ